MRRRQAARRLRPPAGGRYGRHPRCRACRSIQEKERYRKNREAILGQQRTNPVRLAYPKRYWRRTQYGLAEAEFYAMVAAQHGRCAICGELPSDGRLVIDHCHRSGEIRGLLCRLCNAGIGMLGDPERLRSAAAYVEG